MPGLMDMFQPRSLADNSPIGFGDAIAQNRQSLVGLGMGMLQPISLAQGAPAQNSWGNALGGYQQGAAQDARQAHAQGQLKMEQARLNLAKQQANKEPEAIRQLRAAGVPQEKWADYLYPKQDALTEGKITYREQEYPYLRDRAGNYSWPIGRPPGGPGSLPATTPGGAATVPGAPSTTGAGEAAAAPSPMTAQEPSKPAGYDTWLPSVQKEYDKTVVQQQAKQAAALPEQKAQILESGTVALRELDAALKQSEEYPNMVAGPFGNAMKGVWGSQATDVAKRLDVVKANIAFDKLQAMRRSNPTGGALGNVSDKDMALLQSSLASLDQAQSAPQFLEALRNVQTHYRNVLAKVQGPSSGSTTGQTSTGVRKYNPQTGMIE